MNKPKLAAALIGATLIGGVGLALSVPSRAADKPTVSREFAKPLRSAQEDLTKGKFRDALQELAKAKALPKATPYDTHIINELSLYAYAKTKDYANAVKAMEATLDDGFTPPATANSRIKDISEIYYQLKNYGKAAEFGNRAVKGGFADANIYTLVSQAYYQQGNFKEAGRFTENLVNQEIKRGETPKESQMQIVLNSCVKTSDQACVTRTLERLVTYYPRPEYWQDVMDSLFQSKQAESSDADMLNIYRLASDVGAMTMPSQYIEMAQLALEQGSPGDAQQALEKAYGKNVFADQRDRQRADRLLATAKKQAASDQSSLPKLAAEAKSSATGQKDVAVGVAYLGYQQYDKAADALAQGLMKGGVKDEAEARLLLGIAQLKGGHKDDAVKAFQAVTGDPTLVRLASLWKLRARSAAGTVASR